MCHLHFIIFFQLIHKLDRPEESSIVERDQQQALNLAQVEVS